MDFLPWNFGRRKAQLHATSANGDLPLSKNSDDTTVWKSSNSDTKLGPVDRQKTAKRCPSLPDPRTTQVIDSTELDLKALQTPEPRPTDTVRPEFSISRATTLSDPVMLDAQRIAPPPLSQPAQPQEAGACESTPDQVPLPPSRGGSQSDEAPPLQPMINMIEEVGDLGKTRLAVVRTRHKTQEARTGLRHEREALDALDARFIQEIRFVYASSRSAELAHLCELFETMQSSRDKFYPLEDDYNKLEDRLDLEEFELEEAESSLYERGRSLRPLPGYPDDQTSLSQDEGYSPRLHTVQFESQEPAYTDYLSRIGDANMVKERLHELRSERVHLVEEQRVRAGVGLQLDEEGLHFLETFDLQHEKFQHQYTAIQEDLARMREEWPLSIPVPFATTQFADESYSFGTGIIQQLTHASSVINANDLITSTASNTPPSPGDAITLAQHPNSDSLLLPLDDTGPTFTFNDGGENDPIPTVSYVNEWLLNRLRRSSMEVWRFKSADEVQTLHLDDAEVRDLVIQWWSKDATAEDFPAVERAGVISLSLTSNPGVEFQPSRRAWSDSVPCDFNRLAGRRQRADVPMRRDVVSINFLDHPNGLVQNAQLSPGSV